MHLIHAYKLVCTFWHVLFVLPNVPNVSRHAFCCVSECVSVFKCVNVKVGVLLSQPLSKNIEVLFGAAPKPLLKQTEVCD